MSLVSVIMPTYNRPDALGMAVQSVLNQSLQDLEVVVVNDRGDDLYGSVDQLRDHRVKYLGHMRNSGPAAARNTAIKASSGKYIAYLDDDDCYYPQHLETLVSFLESSPARAAYSDALEATVERAPQSYKVLRKTLIYSTDFDLERLLVRNILPNLCLVHERSCLKRSGLFDESLTSNEDWDLLIRLASVCPPVHIPQITSQYHKLVQSERVTVSSNRPDNLRTVLKIYRKYRHMAAHYPKAEDNRRRAVFSLELQIWGKDRFAKLMEIGAFYEKIGEPEQALRIYEEKMHTAPTEECRIRHKAVRTVLQRKQD